MYWVYILRSQKDNKLYIGHTDNLDRRLEEHNSGKDKSTSWRRPFELYYSEQFDSRKEAVRRETFFKKMRNRAFFDKLIHGAIK
jgi:putative endonuclease